MCTTRLSRVGRSDCPYAWLARQDDSGCRTQLALERRYKRFAANEADSQLSEFYIAKLNSTVELGCVVVQVVKPGHNWLRSAFSGVHIAPLNSAQFNRNLTAQESPTRPKNDRFSRSPVEMSCKAVYIARLAFCALLFYRIKWKWKVGFRQ